MSLNRSSLGKLRFAVLAGDSRAVTTNKSLGDSNFRYAARVGTEIRLRKCVFHMPKFVPFLYRRPGKLAFLALLASSETNNLRRINTLNSSTPAASTI
jgi:hypothetical protein